MIVGRIVINIEVIKLMNSTVQQLGILTSDHSEQLEAICKFAMNKSRNEHRERKRMKKTIQKTLIFLQENCIEIEYINKGFFQELIQLVRDL